MRKISSQHIIHQFRSGIENYVDATHHIGLWQSERYVFEKHLDPSMHILDLGCGTGRTTFALHDLGFTQITGLDLTPEMIEAARQINVSKAKDISFRIGDALNLEFEDECFDAAIFSFNGLMTIPGQDRRDRALQEIKRVLRQGGIFIFTTHDRNRVPEYTTFWEEEEQRWEMGLQNPRLYDFGDVIASSKNENVDIYIHIPNEESIRKWLNDSNFKIEETFYRSDLFDESEAIKAISGECRFWVGSKGK